MRSCVSSVVFGGMGMGGAATCEAVLFSRRSSAGMRGDAACACLLRRVCRGGGGGQWSVNERTTDTLKAQSVAWEWQQCCAWWRRIGGEGVRGKESPLSATTSSRSLPDTAPRHDRSTARLGGRLAAPLPDRGTARFDPLVRRQLVPLPGARTNERTIYGSCSARGRSVHRLGIAIGGGLAVATNAKSPKIPNVCCGQLGTACPGGSLSRGWMRMNPFRLKGSGRLKASIHIQGSR